MSRKPQIGILRGWDTKKQFGWIRHGGVRRPIYFDFADVQGGVDQPIPIGSRVEYYIGKRERAVDVRLLDKPAPVPAAGDGGLPPAA